MLRRIEEHGTYLDLRPLRLILLTPELHDRAKDWQRQLGRPEAGVSQQAEGVVGGKTISWGEDGDSARTIILLNDALATGAVLDNLSHPPYRSAPSSTCGLRQLRQRLLLLPPS